jgi:hypothetical protein
MKKTHTPDFKMMDWVLMLRAELMHQAREMNRLLKVFYAARR